MRDHRQLTETLGRIDGRGYKAYKDIQGSYRFARFVLHIDHVQGDPFAAPSRCCARFDLDTLELPEWSYASRARRTALADYLTRSLASELRRRGRLGSGSGKSGEVSIERPTQEVLARSAMVVEPPALECRFYVGLPAQGRTVLGKQATRILVEALPRLLEDSLSFPALDPERLQAHVEAVEDQQALRAQLAERGLVSFIAEGSCLPRRSGVDPRPLDDAVAFSAPSSLAVTLQAPNAGAVAGMGIPEGVSLIVGGGYHGKSTVLDAVQLGVYDHLPGDGREGVVTRRKAVKIRAEDGRRVADVNIGAFIRDLPGGRSTEHFASENASGSTSQAAYISEAIELGTDLLLIDEDTSATNFMIRDARMQSLIAREPIVPFIDRVDQLYRERGVSTIMVVGGAGDYLDVAHTVVLMEEYRAYDVSERARQIARDNPSDRRREVAEPFGELRARIPQPSSLDPSRGKRDVKIDVRGLYGLQFGEWPIELGALEQLVAKAQTRSLGQALLYLKRRVLDGHCTLQQAIDELETVIERDGVDVLADERRGDLAEVRGLEIGACLNRLRSLRVD